MTGFGIANARQKKSAIEYSASLGKVRRVQLFSILCNSWNELNSENHNHKRTVSMKDVLLNGYEKRIHKLTALTKRLLLRSLSQMTEISI